MDAWSYHLPKEGFKSLDGVPNGLAEHRWLPNDAVIRCKENDSVDMATMKPIVEHINKFV